MGKLTCQDLMVGDLVYIHKPECKGHRIDAIDELDGQVGADGEVYDEDDIRSIPLTGDILMKNGFKKNDRGDFVIDDTIVIAKENYCAKNYYACTWYQEDFDDEIYYIGICELTFVHQLQHLMRLCGVEKELTI